MRFTTDNIKSIIQVLEKAITEHRKWLNAWHHSLIFGQPLSTICFSNDSYRRCGFAQWYYSQSSPILSDHSIFILIGHIHRDLHNKAFVLADKIKHYGTISIKDYDLFIAKEQEFSKTIFELRDELREILSEFDPLTDILNRQAFFRILSHEYERSSRTGQPCCICMVDLDHFKSINDTFGHLVGDKVLRNVAYALKSMLRAYDSICRYGGEEFVIVMPDTDLEGAVVFAERLRKRVEESDFAETGDPLRATVSIGVASASVEGEVTETESLIAQADEALYRAKNDGRNRVRP